MSCLGLLSANQLLIGVFMVLMSKTFFTAVLSGFHTSFPLALCSCPIS